MPTAPAKPPAPAPAEKHQTPPAGPTAARPVVALVHLVGTPYWLHLHRRIDRELTEVELHCLYTHDVPDQPWALEKDADVRPLCFGTGEKAESKTIFSSALREWSRAGRIIRWLKQHDARLVVLYGYNDAGRVRILRWCRRRGIPCLLTSDSNARLDRARGLRKFLKRHLVGFAVRSMWGVMPFGSLGAEYFIKYGARKDRVYRFPAEPDYAVIERVTPQDVAAACARFGLPQGRRRIVFCGRLIELKSPEVLIDAFNAIADERPEWDLVIVGDGPLKASMQARVRPEIASRIAWTGFQGDAHTIASIYRACDALVLPSRFDQWALVVNEALASGLAIITSDVVGSSEDLLRPGVNGYTFPVGDAMKLADALREVTRPDRIDAFKSASLDVIREWRRTSDPLDGLRRALVDAGVIPTR